MRSTRLLVGTFTAALVGSVTVLTAAPSGAATTATATAAATCTAPSGQAAVASRVVFYRNKPVTKYAQAIPVRGQVQGQRADGTWGYVAGVTVALARAYPNRSYTSIGSATTSTTDGYFRASTTAWGNASYRVTFSGQTFGTAYLCPVVAAKSIKVSRHEHARIPSGTISFVGNVDPGWARRYVTVQRKTCQSCSWKTYKRVITNSNGGFRAQLSAPRSGRWYFRTYVPASAPRFVATYSNVWYTFRSSGRRA